MNVALQWPRWSRALSAVLSAQLLFWGFYALIIWTLNPMQGLSESRLPAASAALTTLEGPVGAYAPGLSGPALLRLPGWQAIVIYPVRASLLSRADGDATEGWSLTCITDPCGATDDVYAATFERMDSAARLERFQRQDMVWQVIEMGVILGAALLVLLPISRFSRAQLISGVFLILVGADAWLTAFGAAALPYVWFPLLRYGTQYSMLTGMALMVNAFAGWSVREARAAEACCAALFSVVVVAVFSGSNIGAVVPLLDVLCLLLVLVFGGIALWRLVRTAPGPAIRVLALLLVGLASVAWDLVLYRPPAGPPLQASVLSPVLLMFAVLFEIAVQGNRLNQAADEERSDLERQALEQDANLLRSSSLLRHQERRIAIDAERQRLLRDMHDGMGGVLTHLLLDLRRRRLSQDEIEQGLQMAVDDMRNLASAIDAGHGPIDEALAMFRERTAARLTRSQVAFEWRCQLPFPAPSLDARRLLSLYRLLQEGVANALRHAGASRIELAVEAVGDDAVRITLTDDGTGFEPANVASLPGEGRGLANMRHRADQMGGHLRIESAAEQGTQLILTVPVQAAPKPKP
jgi:signal transduction histidine kinase